MNKYSGTLVISQNNFCRLGIGWPLASLALDKNIMVLSIWPFWKYEIKITNIDSIKNKFGAIEINHHDNAPKFIRFGTTPKNKTQLLNFLKGKGIPVE